MTLAFLVAANPWLLAGSALVGVPIIIHILNKRRFKIVRWAAMDLLLSVDLKSRKRLQLEDLLILLLRCLVVLLLAFLVSRLVLDPSDVGLADAATRTERVVVLDDSPSMGQRTGNRSIFQRSTEDLAEAVRELAREQPGDSFTLVLTSRPRQPVFNGQILTEESADQVARTIEGLSLSGASAGFDQVFIGADDWLPSDATAASNRILYVISDFRESDWQSGLDAEGGVVGTLKDLGPRVRQLVLCDVGRAVEQDLAIIDLQPAERNLVSDVPTRFSVTVANRGSSDSDGGTLELTTGQGGAISREFGPIAAGQSQAILVPVQFNGPGSVHVAATLVGDDGSQYDDARHFAGVAELGLPVAVIDGEPDIDPVAAEAFFLRRALSPPGDQASGLRVDVVDEQELAAFDPSPYQVLFLCNVFRLPAETIERLDRWVKAGGVLVMAPGDLVDAGFWSDEMAQTAADLVVVRFADTVGSASEDEWVSLQVTRPDHPVLEVFAGEQNPFLKRLKFYQHWQLEPVAGAEVIATFSDGDPAMVEGTVGLGRVLVLAVPVDAEWSSWPSNPSYLVIMQQIVQRLARTRSTTRNLQVGEPLWFPLDTANYRGTALLVAPESLDGEPMAATNAEEGDEVGLSWPALDRVGGWQLRLETHEGETETVILAANIAADESRAERVAERDVKERLGEVPTLWAERVLLLPGDDGGGRIELARACAYLALLALVIEQLLTWRFTQRRLS